MRLLRGTVCWHQSVLQCSQAHTPHPRIPLPPSLAVDMSPGRITRDAIVIPRSTGEVSNRETRERISHSVPPRRCGQLQVKFRRLAIEKEPQSDLISSSPRSSSSTWPSGFPLSAICFPPGRPNSHRSSWDSSIPSSTTPPPAPSPAAASPADARAHTHTYTHTHTRHTLTPTHVPVNVIARTSAPFFSMPLRVPRVRVDLQRYTLLLARMVYFHGTGSAWLKGHPSHMQQATPVAARSMTCPTPYQCNVYVCCIHP
jgi:hypothetical protein